jgi:hypothetical protein
MRVSLLEPVFVRLGSLGVVSELATTIQNSNCLSSEQGALQRLALIRPFATDAIDLNFSDHSFAVLRIIRSGMVCDTQMAIIEPFHLGIVKPARTAVPKYPHVLAAFCSLQFDLSIVTTEKARVVEQGCLLSMR